MATMATGKEKGSISVRPAKEYRPRLIQIATETGRSEGQLINECAEAVLRMIETNVPTIPQIVTQVKLLRKEKATFLDPERPFPKTARVLHGEPLAESPSKKTAVKHKSHK